MSGLGSANFRILNADGSLPITSVRAVPALDGLYEVQLAQPATQMGPNVLVVQVTLDWRYTAAIPVIFTRIV